MPPAAFKDLAGKVAVGAAAILVAAACGSSGSQPQATGKKMTGTLVFAQFTSFTGPNASFGPEGQAGCIPAANLINAAGGVLGHRATCLAVDTRGDPADAVPAANQLLASQPNLVAVLGPTSDEADATVPLFDAAKITMFSSTGAARYDRSNFHYFWRNTPADDVNGYALALWAKRKGYQRVAAVFGSDISSQGSAPTARAGFKKLGGTIAISLNLSPDQSSYRSEVESALAAHPDAIFTEEDPQTAATFFQELKQLNGSLLPIIGTQPTQDQSWLQAVSRAVGPSALAQAYTSVAPYAAASGQPWQAYNQAHMSAGTAVPDPSQRSSDPNSMTAYDEVNIIALAMIVAHSPDPAVYNSYITRVTTHSPGATVVRNYREGKAALAAGKTVDYVGNGGELDFNKWHNSPGGFGVYSYNPTDPSNQSVLVGTIGPDQIATLTK